MALAVSHRRLQSSCCQAWSLHFRKWQEASVSRHVGLFLGLPADCPHDIEAGLFRASDPRGGETGAFY